MATTQTFENQSLTSLEKYSCNIKFESELTRTHGSLLNILSSVHWNGLEATTNQ